MKDIEFLSPTCITLLDLYSKHFQLTDGLFVRQFGGDERALGTLVQVPVEAGWLV